MMMGPTKLFGMLSIIPTAGLLTIGFFVMVVLRKIEESALKSFGRIVAALLCIAAFLMFAMGLYVIGAGNCPVMNMIGKCGVPKYKKSLTCGRKGMSSKMMQKGIMHKGMMHKDMTGK